MQDYARRAVMLLLIILVVILSITHVKPREPVVKLVQDPNYVQNIGEAQRRLKEQGLYHGEIDYIWGPETEKGYCDYCAIQAVEGR